MSIFQSRFLTSISQILWPNSGQNLRRKLMQNRSKLSPSTLFGVVAISACSTLDPLNLSTPEPPIRQPTYDLLHKAHELQEKHQAQKALDLLNSFYPRVKGLPKDRAMIHQARAYLWIAEGDLSKAAPFLEKSIAGEPLGPTTTNTLRFKLAQIYLHEGRLEEGIRILESWFSATEQAKPADHALAGQAYYLAGKYHSAIAHLNRALLDPNPKDSWYAILLSSYLKTNSVQEAKSIIGTLLKLLPNQRDYWLQLIAIETKLDNKANALASFELAQRVGVLTSKEILQIVKLNLQKNLPHRAAELLESGLHRSAVPLTRENWQLLADAWILAREYQQALVSLKKVEKLSTSSTEQYTVRRQQGEVLMRLQQWPEAQDLLQNLPRSPEAKIESRTQLLLGISAYYSRNYDLSHRSFSMAVNDSSTRALAKNWLERTEWIMGSKTPR